MSELMWADGLYRLMAVRRERAQLAGVVFVILFAQVLLYPGVPQLVAALGQPSEIGAGTQFLAAEFAGVIMFAALWGAASDTVGRRTPFIIVGALGGAVSYLALVALLPVDPPFLTVLALRFIQGAATGGAFSLAVTMLIDLPGGRGKNTGAAGIAIGLGTALGAPVGGRLYDVDVRAPLVATAILFAVAAVLIIWVTDRAPDMSRTTVSKTLVSVQRRPSLLVPYAFGLVDRTTAGFFALVGTFFFQSEFGLDPAGTGLLLGAFFGPFALLQYPFGILSDRIGRTLPIAVGSLFFGLAVVGVGTSPSVVVAATVMMLVGVGGALCAPATLALVGDLAGADDRGTAVGGFNIVGSVGFLLGTVVGGVLADRFGYEVAFLVVGGAEILLAVGLLPALLGLEPEEGRAAFGSRED
jgi:MFS family permease